VKRRLRALVVEDDSRIRRLVEDILEPTATVESAGDADEALRIFIAAPRQRFDLVIVDCLLPIPGGGVAPRGVELIGRLHERYPTLPIIAITGAPDADALIVAAFRGGARDLLRKPFGVEDLRASVARVTLQPHRRGAPPRTREAIARVLTFLAEHTNQHVSLGALAQLAAMSRSHLSRTFRHTVGVPLRVYVRNLRLEHAQKILAGSPASSLTDVALDAGFYDLPHFDKAFRERYGVSPSEFLRRRALAQHDPRRRRARRTA